MAKKSREVEALLKKYPSPKSVLGARILPSGEGLNELTKAYPELSGFLESALMGTAPDGMGSVLDPTTAGRRAGAEYGFPAGIAAQVAPLLSPLSKFARGVAAAPSMVPGSMAAQRGVIKAPGGNWLAGSVENALRGLKRPEGDMARRMEAAHGQRVAPIPEADRADALNTWIDKQLTRYVKNDMATPNDPVRALAERGVLHYAPEESTAGPGLRTVRARAGYPESGMAGSSDLAQTWETNADFALNPPLTASEVVGNANFAAKNPWAAKVAPETPVNWTSPSNEITRDTGFSHLIDELRNATNPASGLPLDLQLKYSSLNQVSVPQAVERVAAINAWRAAQKAEADAARAMNPATHVFKEYAENNPKGFKWTELKKPEQLPEGWSQGRANIASGEPQFYHSADPEALTRSDPRMEALRDALKYEGDTMGHCVGGYCDDVASGKSRIYSLRSGKGQPHVTVEVAPQKRWNTDVVPNVEEDAGQRIVQIKGKGNKAPADEYLPYVQDFVKSGKWSDVGDLRNTGLSRVPADSPLAAKLKEMGEEVPNWVTDAEYEALTSRLGLPKYAKGGLVKQKAKPACGCEHNYADGGLVQGYDPAAVDAHLSRLRAEFAL